MISWLMALACFGSTNNPTNTDDTSLTEADADTDTDTDSDTDVVQEPDSGILEIYWEGTWTETFVGTHSLVAYYNRYETDADPDTDPFHCVYSWDTIGAAVLTTCESCDFAFTVEHSSGEPSNTANCKNTLQLGLYGETLDDQQLGYATTHIVEDEVYNNVLLEYTGGSWTYVAPALWDGITLTYQSTISYYYY